MNQEEEQKEKEEKEEYEEKKEKQKEEKAKERRGGDSESEEEEDGEGSDVRIISGLRALCCRTLLSHAVCFGFLISVGWLGSRRHRRRCRLALTCA